MSQLIDLLTPINIEIPLQENSGNRGYFELLLAPKFTIRRAGGEYQNRDEYLKSLESGGQRRCIAPTIKILPLGPCRVLVQSVVERDGHYFDNARLFTRSPNENDWKLLAWANEEVEQPQA